MSKTEFVKEQENERSNEKVKEKIMDEKKVVAERKNMENVPEGLKDLVEKYDQIINRDKLENDKNYLGNPIRRQLELMTCGLQYRGDFPSNIKLRKESAGKLNKIQELVEEYCDWINLPSEREHRKMMHEEENKKYRDINNFLLWLETVIKKMDFDFNDNLMRLDSESLENISELMKDISETYGKNECEFGKRFLYLIGFLYPTAAKEFGV